MNHKLILLSFCHLLLTSTLCGQSGDEFQLLIGGPDSSEYASSFIIDEKEDIYMATIAFHRIDRRSRFKLFKISKDGAVLWSKLYPEYNATIFPIIKQNDGSLILAGGAQDSVGSYTLPGSTYLLKTDPFGNPLWEKFFHCGDRGSISQLFQTYNGWLMMADGYFSKASENGKTICLIKTDFDGNQIWGRQYNIHPDAEGTILTQLQNGQFLFILREKTFKEEKTTTIQTISPDGEVLAQKEVNVAGISDVIEATDGSIIFQTSENIQVDSGVYESVAYLKTIRADACITLHKFPAGYSIRGIKITAGHNYVAGMKNKKFIIFKLNKDFELVGEATIQLEGKKFIDAFFITNEENLIFNCIVQKPLPELTEANKKTKYNYDIQVQKINLTPLFK